MTDSAIPATFPAFVAARDGDDVRRGVRDFAAADLPEGEVEVAVEWSSVNYKDALATIRDGKVARISPLIAGIDLAGTVIASSDPTIQSGDGVIAHGYDLAVNRHGGVTAAERVAVEGVVPARAGGGGGWRWRWGRPPPPR
jgi:NADPH:quinone reductase-like Zn-dependent oxidoreductase